MIMAQNWWQPKADDRLTWQLQFANSNNINTNYDVDMYDIDLFDVSDDVIATLHEQGKIVICYFSAGTYESYRDDWSQYFPFIKPDQMYKGDQPPFGKVMADWPEERWLDIRRIDLLIDIMTSRMDYAVQRGCDGIDPDNVDVWSNTKEAGLPTITYNDQLTYNRWLATEAHKRNLSIGLKNDLDQLQDLVSHFDFAINEQCFHYKECSKYQVLTYANKAVFGVECVGSPRRFCPKAKAMKLSFMKKHDNLDAWRIACN